jgi:DNA-binding transcriptional ArsR family regulator
MAKKEKKKPIFEKVGIVFRNPLRADIMHQLSEKPQRPSDIAQEIGIQKQNLNYHLNALKKGGLIKTHSEEVSEANFPSKKGTRINGLTKNGKLKVSFGVELTKNGKNIANQFIEPLFEKNIDNNEIKNSINEKNDEENEK